MIIISRRNKDNLVSPTQVMILKNDEMLNTIIEIWSEKYPDEIIEVYQAEKIKKICKNGY